MCLPVKIRICKWIACAIRRSYRLLTQDEQMMTNLTNLFGIWPCLINSDKIYSWKGLKDIALCHVAKSKTTINNSYDVKTLKHRLQVFNLSTTSWILDRIEIPNSWARLFLANRSGQASSESEIKYSDLHMSLPTGHKRRICVFALGHVLKKLPTFTKRWTIYQHSWLEARSFWFNKVNFLTTSCCDF